MWIGVFGMLSRPEKPIAGRCLAYLVAHGVLPLVHVPGKHQLPRSVCRPLNVTGEGAPRPFPVQRLRLLNTPTSSPDSASALLSGDGLTDLPKRDLWESVRGRVAFSITRNFRTTK